MQRFVSTPLAHTSLILLFASLGQCSDLCPLPHKHPKVPSLILLCVGLGPALGGIMWAASLSFDHAGQQAFPFLMVALVAVIAHFMYGYVRLPNLK